MTQTLERMGAAEPLALLPRDLAALMRPELPSLTGEIVAEIRRTIPEYARPMDGPYGQTLRAGVEHAITAFVDQVADPSKPHRRRDAVCRELGRVEAREGRSMDSLQAAYRVGARLAWRRITKVGQHHNFSSEVMSLLAEGVFAYMDELASQSLAGYLEEKGRSVDALTAWRRRLLRLLLERPPAPHAAILGLAAQAGWSVPTEVTLVAVRIGAPGCGPFPDGDLLLDLDPPDPHLLVPGAVDASLCDALSATLPAGRAAIGPTVPLAKAWDSLRWARQALTLAETGVIDGGSVVLCEDHLLTLLLLSDEALVDQIARQQLGPLMKLPAKQRGRLTETLEAWLETSGGVPEVAGQLYVHPQTVRYRKRQLEGILGERLDDPDARFMMEFVLRAMRLRDRDGRSRGDTQDRPMATR